MFLTKYVFDSKSRTHLYHSPSPIKNKKYRVLILSEKYSLSLLRLILVAAKSAAIAGISVCCESGYKRCT